MRRSGQTTFQPDLIYKLHPEAKRSKMFQAQLAHFNEQMEAEESDEDEILDMDHEEVNEETDMDHTQVGRGGRKSMGNLAMEKDFIPINNHDILMALKEVEMDVINHLKEQIQRGIKWYINLHAVFIKSAVSENGLITEKSHDIYQGSKTYTALYDEEIEDVLPEVFQTIFTKFQEFERQGSGWRLDKVEKVEVFTAAYEPLHGTSHLPLPEGLKDSRSILNIRNNDTKCFLWSVLAHLHPVKNNKKRVYKYRQYEKELNTDGITFPMRLRDIKKFEKQNNLSINVFGFEEDIIPLHLAKHSSETEINLLLISKGEKNHYCLITNFNGLMNRRTKYHGKMFYCFNCLHGYVRQDLLDAHKPICMTNKPQRLKFPEEKTIQFKAVAKQLRIPFIIYADLECYTVPQDGTKYQHHVPNSFAYIIVSTNEKYNRKPVLYRGEDVIEVFFDKLLEEERRIQQIMNDQMGLVMSENDIKNFVEVDNCHICDKPLGEDRVRDHDHITGIFRGAAHSNCNLQYRLTHKSKVFIPVVFHNLRGYDSHCLMERLGKYKKKKLTVIPNTIEKYISFSLGGLRFIDSLQFMNSSLAALVTNLASEGKQKFKVMSKYADHQDLLLRKGVYPYDYVNESTKFEDTELPSKDKFYSHLQGDDITDEDYQHAQTVWNTFECETFGDYHDLYLISDVMLLADVFENFRDVCLETYELDPAHYFTAPGLSWDAMLKYTEVTLDLIDDIDMYQMVEKGSRGGISMISHKYAKANNPYIDDYDEEKPDSYIMYYDANNLYGWAQSQALPSSNFAWVSEPEQIDIMSIPEDAETGYIFEVDLEYPTHLHDLHNDYPVAAERKRVKKEELSPYSKAMKDELQISESNEKLVPNLHSKSHYVLHYRNLQQYINLGLKLSKIHRAISFSQSKFLEPYIRLNTDKRKEAKNPFEKDFFKLMNNAIFGKTMENVRKRVNVELVHRPERFRKTVAKPTFHRFKVFNEDLTAVHCLQAELTLSKPIYIGMCILDLSKVLMYEFHYEYIKPMYPDAKLLFTDTDSLCYHIPTRDVYVDMYRHAEKFDTSDYSKNHFLHSDVNKKVLGKMKDETAGIAVKEFCGLRPKMYSILYGDGEEKKTAKGIVKSCIQKMRHSEYVKCLTQRKQTQSQSNQIRCYDHQIYSETIKKIALSPYDDKRYVLKDGITTLAHGHFKTMLPDFDS